MKLTAEQKENLNKVMTAFFNVIIELNEPVIRADEKQRLIDSGWKSPEEIKQFFKELESNGDYDTMEAYMKFKAKWLGEPK